MINQRGSNTQTHNTTGGYTTSSEAGSGNGTSHTNTSVAESHTHDTENGTTDAGNSLPPYLDMVYASIDSDGVGEADSGRTEFGLAVWEKTKLHSETGDVMVISTVHEAGKKLEGFGGAAAILRFKI